MAGSAAGSAERPPRVSVDRAVDVLRAGGLVVAPTETLVGILADAFCARAVARAAALKRRPPGEPFPVLVSSLPGTAFVSTQLPAGARLLARRFWPGPLTLLLPALDGLPPELVGPGGTVAVRVPGPSLARRIVGRFRGPLIATSANPRGASAPTDTAGVAPEILAAVDAVVAGRSPGGVPSTIVALAERGYRIVRPGAVSEADIRSTLA